MLVARLATVSVRSIEVVGRVSPRNAVVSVFGRPASVVGGEFKLPLRLVGAVLHVTIVATAGGYVTSRTHVTVRYSGPLPSQQNGGRSSGAVAAGPSVDVLGRANRLCAARNKQVLALPILTPANVAAHDAAMATINATIVQQLRALETTWSPEGTLAPYIDFLATAATNTARFEAAAKAGNGALATQLTQQEFGRSLQLNSAARASGIPACGQAALWSVGSGRS